VAVRLRSAQPLHEEEISECMGNRIEVNLASIHDHGIVVDARTGRVPRSEFPPQDTGPGLQIEEN
jgi:hypothetical protein